MKKIFEGSDGRVREIDALHALDEVFAYFRMLKSDEDYPMFVSYDEHGAVEFIYNDKWCKLYTPNHPDAPGIDTKKPAPAKTEAGR